MDQYENQFSTTPPRQLSARPVAGTRRYRSKSQRPCDLCRTRKVLCNIPEPAKPCQLCEQTGRKCTFLRNPGRKQRERARGAQGGTPSPVVLPDSDQVVFLDKIQESGQLLDGRNSSDHNAHQNILELSGTEIVAFLVLCVFTNKHLDRHVPASSGVAGANVPSLENIILDMIWPGQGDMNWHLPLDEPAQLSVEDADPAFQFLCDSDLPDLGSLEGNTPSDDLHNVGMINQMADNLCHKDRARLLNHYPLTKGPTIQPN